MTIAARLYLEILFVAAILMTILFTNNIFLYKQNARDFISQMLIAGIVTCVFEILWVLLDGHPTLSVLSYTCVCCYFIAFILFAALLNRYLLDRLGIHPDKKWNIIGYVAPIVVIILLCVTTSWTRLFFYVDEGGRVYMVDFLNTFFLRLVYLYLFTPLLIAVYFLTLGKEKRPAEGKIPASIFVFGIMAPALYGLEMLLLGDMVDDYENTSLPIALALVYLVTNVSTHSALDTQAKIEAVESELRIASKIQLDALPDVAPTFDNHPEVILRGSIHTAKEVGGDFFDYFSIDDDHICFLIADVSGKGTPAALFMMRAKTMIKDYALTRDSTAEIFTEVNARLCENNDEGMFATSWIGIIDTRTMTLQYTNAGHNYPVLQRKDQPCEEMKEVHGLFLGGMEFTQYRQGEIQLEAGDRLLLYTDGVVEAHNQADELYGIDRLQAVLETTRNWPGGQMLERVFDDVNIFATGVSQFDDITMVVLTMKE